MIQRLQSFWLLLAAICAFLTINFSFYSGNIIVGDKPVSFQYLNATFSIWLLIITIAMVCIGIIDIFLYKNRKLQGRLALLGLLLSLGNIFIYLREIHRFVEHEGSHTLTAIFVFAIPFFFFLAFRGIRKDEKLVKSLDRLR